MITTILFDLGGVFFFPGSLDTLIKAYAKAVKKPYKTMKPIVHKAWKKWRLGHCDEEKFIRKIGIVDVEKYKGLYVKHYKPNRFLFTYLATLRKKYVVAAVSNVSLEWATFWEEKYKLSRKFDAVFFSCDLQLAKPDKRFYDQILYATNTGPQECVFIDDQMRNLLPAKKMGMQTIHYKTLAQLKKDVTAIIKNSHHNPQ